MDSTTQPIAVYGASGHTGRFLVREACDRGLPFVAVGRDAARLDEALPPGVERRVAALDDPAALERAFSGCGVVVNCAGPFLDTAASVIRAALRAGCHYIDVTAEQASARASFAHFDVAARAAGRVVVPAAGFYGGLADLLATALAGPDRIDEITVATALDRWWPTAGTRRTGERNRVPRVVVKDGHLAPLTPSPTVPHWVFSPPLGVQTMVELPFSEIITLSRHFSPRTIRTLLNRSAVDDVRDATTPPPTASDARGRSTQRFEMVVQLAQGGAMRTAGARGRDIYAVTAPIVLEAALRLRQPVFPCRGALALAEAVPPVEVLRALHGRDLEVFGLASVG